MQLFRNLTIKSKLGIGFGLMMGIAAVLAIAAYGSTSKSKEAIRTLGEVTLPGMTALDDIKVGIETIKSAQRTLMIPGLEMGLAQQQFESIEKAREKYGAAQKSYEALSHEADERAIWKELELSLAELKSANNQFLGMAKTLVDLRVGDPLDLKANLASFRGDHYALQVAVLLMLNENKSFDGGNDHTACNFGKWLNGSSQKIENPTIAKIIQEVREPHRQFHEAIGEAQKLFKAGDGRGAANLFNKDIVPAANRVFGKFEELLKNSSDASELFGKVKTQGMEVCLVPLNKTVALIDRIVEVSSKNDRREIAGIKNNASSTQFLVMITALSGIIAAALLGFLITRSITQPVTTIVSRLDKIAQGDISSDVDGALQSRGDEIGVLAQSLQTVSTNLRAMLQDVTGGVQTLASSSTELTAISGQMAGSSQDTSSRSGAVAAASEELSANAASVAAGMEQMTANLSSVAAATEEMSATIGEIASNSEKARAISAAANEQAQGVAALMRQLGTAAQEIGKVTETITSISAQTNLLALNATIEAARAGAAGKGFAVVANEIKALAQQTAQATEEIKGRIAGVQTSTGAAMADVDKIAGVIQEVGGIVVTIATAIEQQAAVTRDMARNVAEASSGVNDANQRVAQTAAVSQEIARDIAGVNTAAGAIASGSQQVQTSAVELSQLSEQLQGMVGRFKLNECQGPATTASASAAGPGKAFFEWSEALSVGVLGMDDQHKRFFVLINQLHQGMKQGHGDKVLGGVLDELARYTEYHFKAEEALLERCNYPELPQQKEAHVRFVAKVHEFQQRFARGDRAVVLEAMTAVRDWLVSHIQKMDKKYGPYLQRGKAGKA